MKRHGGVVLLLALLAVFALGMSWLFDLRLSGGDVYPPYSTLRADPLGTRALHDALSLLSEVGVERSLKELRKLPDNPPRTIVLAGISRFDWFTLPQEDSAALDRAVRSGSRLVITFLPEKMQDENETQRRIDEKKEDEREEKNPKNRDHVSEERRKYLPKRTEWKERWGFEVHPSTDTQIPPEADRAPDAPPTVPDKVTWNSDLRFAGSARAGWKTIYQRGTAPVMIERMFGRGSVVVATDSYFFSNEALLKDRRIPLIQWLLSPHSRVVFCEAHLGVVEAPGIAALGRRYGLGPAFFTLLLAAALFIWQRSVLFVPPPPAADEVALSYHQTAGLEALLRRAIRPGNLISICAQEWFKTARTGDAGRVRTTLASSSTQRPVDLYNAVVQALKRRL